jgi:hypothetical protein
MRVIQRGTHAIARLAHFGVGQPNNMERGQSRPEVNFDRYFRRINTRERAARNGGN